MWVYTIKLEVPAGDSGPAPHILPAIRAALDALLTAIGPEARYGFVPETLPAGSPCARCLADLHQCNRPECACVCRVHLLLRPIEGSSNVAAIGYDPTTLTLVLLFRSSRAVYQFTTVPAAEVDGLRKAQSKGAYFAAHIKGHYPMQKLVDRTPVDTKGD